MKTISTFLFLIQLTIFSVIADKPAPEIFSRVKIDLDGREVIELAKLGLALQAFDFEQGVSFTGEFSKYELDILTEAGFKYEVLIHNVTEYYQKRNVGIDKNEVLESERARLKGTKYSVPINFTLGSMGGFHTYDELLADLDLMHELFPHLISERLPISDTLSIEGRPIYWVRISNTPNDTTDKPKVLYTALMHAREPASMQQMLFQMWYLLENYSKDAEIKYLVDNIEMYFIPCINPDGYIYNEMTNPDGGGMQRKNMRLNHSMFFGVDINRNFGYMWGYDDLGSSPDTYSQAYRGTGPFSEPETWNIKKFAETIDFSLALNNHTFSDLLIYPWGYEDKLTPDSLIFLNYARILTRKNHYLYGTVYETLWYWANGVSDDWFYGEQETKNKVFAFTPEAGSPHDGFWPQITKIIDICANHVHMNNSTAHLALPYAEVRDITGRFIEDHITEIEVEIINYGQYEPANYHVSIQPISDNFISFGGPIYFEEMDVLEVRTGSIEIQLSKRFEPGDKIEYLLILDNGMYQWEQPITKYFGKKQVMLFDPCDNMDHWESNRWGVCNSIFYSPPGAIADSPGSNYSNHLNSPVTLKEYFDLRNALAANVNFQMRYRIQKNRDYVQFQVSIDDRVTWTPLAGRYTQNGAIHQDYNKPVYHGLRNAWSLEEIDLTPFVGNKVWLRFLLKTDATIVHQGFYFDDFEVTAVIKDKYIYDDDDDNGDDDNGDDDDENFVESILDNNDIDLFYKQITNELVILIPELDNRIDIKVIISDISGRIIHADDYNVNSSFSINLDDCIQGVYIASITGDYITSKKFVIIK